jgi:hypothetical protein
MSLTNRQRYAQFNSKEWHKIEFNDATDSYIVIHKNMVFTNVKATYALQGGSLN